MVEPFFTKQKEREKVMQSSVPAALDEEWSSRWGIPWLDGGFTSIMNVMLKHYHELDITNTEMMLIIHLASYAYESKEGKCRPALTSTIRERMGYRTNLGVISVLESLEEKGMVEVTRRPNRTSLYDLSLFARRVMELADRVNII